MRALLIFLSTLLIVAIGIVSFVMADTSSQEYQVTITGASNIVITAMDINFDSCLPGGNCGEIMESIRMENRGNQAPGSGIDGNFTTNVSTNYGLNYTTNIINASNFQLNNTAFYTNATAREIVAAASMGAAANITVNAELAIPSGQTAGAYKGTILLTWTA